jgi:hypothetical protein
MSGLIKSLNFLNIRRNSCLMIAVIIFLFSQNCRASILDGFMFKPALTFEYQYSDIMGKNQNDEFKNKLVEHQLKNFSNLVPGLNFRLHKYWSINTNWSQFVHKNENLDGYNITNKASLKIENYNISSMFHVPLIGDHLLEGFVEIGASDINSNLKFTTASGQNDFKSHETAFLYGAGFSFAPYDANTVFRVSFQTYDTKLPSINANISTYRIGFMKYF